MVQKAIDNGVKYLTIVDWEEIGLDKNSWGLSLQIFQKRSL